MGMTLDKDAVKAQIHAFIERYYTQKEEDETDRVEMSDLDSFTLIQLLLYLEDTFDIVVLEELHTFSGGDFDEFASFVVSVGSRGAVPTA